MKRIVAFLLVLPLLSGACLACDSSQVERQHDCHEAEGALADAPCHDLMAAMCEEPAHLPAVAPDLTGAVVLTSSFGSAALAPAPLLSPASLRLSTDGPPLFLPLLI